MNISIVLDDFLSKVNLDSLKVLAKQEGLPLEFVALRHLEFLMSKRPAIAIGPATPPPKTAQPAPTAAQPASSKRAKPVEPSDDPIAALGLGTRAYNVITKKDKLGVSTLDGFLSLSEDDITSCPGAGKAVVEEILEAQRRIQGVPSKAPEVVESTPVQMAEEPQLDYVPIFKKLPKDPNGLKEAIKLFIKQTGKDMDETKAILGASGVDKSDFESIINLLLDNMPIQPSQIMTIREVGKELGEKLIVIEEDRPLAAFGKGLNDLNVGEAQSMIDAMMLELKEVDKVEPEDDGFGSFFDFS